MPKYDERDRSDKGTRKRERAESKTKDGIHDAVEEPNACQTCTVWDLCISVAK